MRFLLLLFLLISSFSYSQSGTSYLASEIKFRLIDYFVDKKMVISETNNGYSCPHHFIIESKMVFTELDSISDMNDYITNVQAKKSDVEHLSKKIIRKIEKGKFKLPSHQFYITTNTHVTSIKIKKNGVYKVRYDFHLIIKH